MHINLNEVLVGRFCRLSAICVNFFWAMLPDELNAHEHFKVHMTLPQKSIHLFFMLCNQPLQII